MTLQDFFSLTPDAVLSATEAVGERTTGLCYPLGSLENRVYEVELESGARVVTKFYRPGRWSAATIGDEHTLLLALQSQEIPVCAPLPLKDGRTLGQTPEGILFCVFPRTGGRSPDELDVGEYAQLGRLLGRIHNVAASLPLVHRPALNPATYGLESARTLEASPFLPDSMKPKVLQAIDMLVAQVTPLFAAQTPTLIHADCHRGNLLRGREGFFFLDFDDMATGPAVQDLWLLLPARPKDCPQEIDALVEGYRAFRAFEHSSLRLIEGLRALRYVRYAAWIARRYDDPSFSRTFTDFNTEMYWQRLAQDLYEQLAWLDSQAQDHPY